MVHLNALAGGLFLLTIFGVIAVRQIIGGLRLFFIQSVLLAGSACILGYEFASIHLLVVAGITLAVKAILIPWLLLRTLSDEVHARREITQVLNIPTSLLVAAVITIFAYFIVQPLLTISSTAFTRINLPIGTAGLLLGAYTMTVRREALAQVLGVLTMENGAFLAGVSIAPNLPLIAELAAAFDVLIIAMVMGLLARRIHKQVGTTLVGEMATLKEE
jgi:hydrogenase-4 component E